MVYDDFVIQILSGEEVKARWRGAGADGTFVIPAELAAAYWEPYVLRGRELDSASSTATFRPLTVGEIGELLFQALFTGEVLELFTKSLPDPHEKPGRMLRIRLEIDRRLAEVSALPWELLRVPSTRDFLALSRRTPIVRSLEVLRPVVPELPVARLRILVIASSSGVSALDLEAERRDLEAIAGWRRNLDVVPLPQADRGELSQALREAEDLGDPFHVIHFMGHGSFRDDTGVLIFENEGHPSEEVTGESLAEQVKNDFPSLRLVVLNACHSGRMAERSGLDPFAGVASALVLGGIPTVIAMRSRISDQTAITLSKTLYQRLVKGDPVDVAMADCRRAIQRQEEVEGEWGLPLVFLQGLVQPLFQVQPDPRLREMARGTLGAALTTLFALVIAFLSFGLRPQPVANPASPAAVAEALELNNAGIALLDQRKIPEARDTFVKALQTDPGFAPAHANLAELDAGRGNYSAALDHARAALRAAPKTALYEYNLGIILSHMGRNEEALEHLGRATKLDSCPAKAQAFNERGNIFLDLDLPADARQELEQGLHCDSSFAPLHKNLARVDLAQDRNEDAIRKLKEALSLYDPRDARGSTEALYWLAVANFRVGRKEIACETLEQVQAQGATAVLWEYESKGLAQQAGCGGVFKER